MQTTVRRHHLKQLFKSLISQALFPYLEVNQLPRQLIHYTTHTYIMYVRNVVQIEDLIRFLIVSMTKDLPS